MILEILGGVAIIAGSLYALKKLSVEADAGTEIYDDVAKEENLLATDLTDEVSNEVSDVESIL